MVNPDQLPEKQGEKLIWIKRQLYKYKEEREGQLAELKMKESRYPNFNRELYPNQYPDPLESTLKRMKNKTGSKIADKIFDIYYCLSH
jgi:hypothetical protein